MTHGVLPSRRDVGGHAVMSAITESEYRPPRRARAPHLARSSAEIPTPAASTTTVARDIPAIAPREAPRAPAPCALGSDPHWNPIHRDRFPRGEIGRVLRDAFGDYDRQRPGVPFEREAGARLMAHFAALTVGFYRAVLARGLPEHEARRRTAELTWLVYKKMAEVPWAIARIMERKPYGRLKRATDLFRRFPFRAPSYDMVDFPAGCDVVAFDVRRCPVAEYFRAQGLSQLCVDAWCNLDVPLGSRRGGELMLPKVSIASGRSLQ
jgi:hypothetical protein